MFVLTGVMTAGMVGGWFRVAPAKWAFSVMTRGKVRRVAKPPMVMRSFRVSAKLWAAAKAKADEREENLADVIREALERYVRSRNGNGNG